MADTWSPERAEQDARAQRAEQEAREADAWAWAQHVSADEFYFDEA